MFYAFRDHKHFTCIKRDHAISKLNVKHTFHNDEDFICIRMIMPNKLSLNFYQLKLIVIHFRNNTR